MIDELTAELGALVAEATALPTSIDPVRPPAVPGCFVGPATLTPDAETNGRLIVAQWEVGAIVPANTGAWGVVAIHGEHITAAVIGHPTLGLVDGGAVLYPAGDTGELPGYRVNVAVLVHAIDIAQRVPPVPPVTGTPAPLVAHASLYADGGVIVPQTISGTVAMGATASLAANAEVVPVVVVDGSPSPMTATATLAVAGAPVAAGFTPTDIANLTIWLDASDPATITASGGLVSQWASKTNGHLFTQATGANQPSTGTRTLNGLNAVEFDGTSDIIGCLSGIPNPSAMTCFMVLVHDAAAGADDGLFGNPGDAGGWLIRTSDGGFIHVNGGVSWESSTPPYLMLGQPSILTMSLTHNAAGPPNCWVNGAPVTAWRAGSGAVVHQAGIALGGRYMGGPTDRAWDGVIGEFLDYNAVLTAPQRAQVETYLAAKWGVTVPAAWSPAALPGLAGWWDASDASTITASGGKVSQWRSKFGLGHLTQGTASAQPVTGTTTLNGRNVILFDGVDDAMVAVLAGTSSNRHTFYNLHTHTDNGDHSPTAFTGFADHAPYGSSPKFHQVYHPAGGGSAFDQGPVLTNFPVAGAACLWSAILDGTGLHSQVRTGGEAPTNDAAYTPTAFGVSQCQLGGQAAGRIFGGAIAEVIHCTTALTGADKANLDAYLIAKWGVT